MAINPFEDQVTAALSTIPGAEEPVREIASSQPLLSTESIVDEVDRRTNQGSMADMAYTYGKPPAPNLNEIVGDFANEQGITEERATDLLGQYSKEDAIAVLDAERTLPINPEIVEWGAMPENYPYYKKNSKTLLDLAKARPKPHFGNDITQALYRNVPMLENLLAVGLYSAGALDKQSFAGMLKNIDDRRANFTPYGTDMSGWEAAQKEWKADTEKMAMGVNELRGMPLEHLEDYMRMTIRGAEISGATSLDMLEYAWSAIRNPRAVTLQGLESAGSTIGPTGVAIGAHFIPVGGVPGLFVKAAAGITGATMVRYAEAVHEELQEYRQEDGTMDYMAVLEDDEKMQRINEIARQYGLVGGSLDYLLNLFGGKLASSTMKQKALKAGFDVASEGIAEGTATTTREVKKGADLGEAIGEGLYKGLEESILVTPTKGVLSAVGAIPTMKGFFEEKLRVAKQEANTAVKREEKIRRVKEIKEKVKDSVTNDEEAKKLSELLDDVVKPDEVTEYDPEQTIDEDEQKIEEEVKVAPEVEVKPESISKVWVVSSAIKSGLDPAAFQTLLDRLSPETRETWLSNEKNGNEIAQIPLGEWVAATRDLDESLDDHIFTNEDELKSYLKQVQKPKAETKPKEDEAPKAEEKPKTEETPKTEDTPKAEDFALSRFKNAEEEQVFNEIEKEVDNALKKNKGIPEKVFDDLKKDYASTFFLYLRRRSELTGKPISLLKRDRPIKHARAVGRYGGYIRSLSLGQNSIYVTDEETKKTGVRSETRSGWETHLNKNTTGLALFHELAHGILEDMAADWEHIHSIEEDKLTPMQKNYKETMQYVADWLGIKELKGIQKLEKGIHPHHEKFAVTAEKFFFEGKYDGIKTAKMLFRVQQMLRMTQHSSTVGMGYESKGLLPDEMSEEVNSMYANVMGLGEAVDEEVFPLIPEFGFNKEMLGEDYIRLRDMYREALDTVLAKHYAELVKQEGEAKVKKVPKNIEKLVERKVIEKVKDTYWFKLYNYWQLQPHMKLNLEDIPKPLRLEIYQQFIQGANRGFGIDHFIDLGLVDPNDVEGTLARAFDYENTMAEARYNILRTYNPNISNLEQLKANAKNKIINDKALAKIRQEASKIALANLREEQGLDPSAVDVFDGLEILKDGVNTPALQTALDTPSGISIDDKARRTFKTKAAPRRFFTVAENWNSKGYMEFLDTLKTSIVYLEEQFKKHLKEKNFTEALDMWGHLQIQRKAQEHLLRIQKEIQSVNKRWNVWEKQYQSKVSEISVKLSENSFLIVDQFLKVIQKKKAASKTVVDTTANPVNNEIAKTFENMLYPNLVNYPSYRNLLKEAAFKNMIMESLPEVFTPQQKQGPQGEEKKWTINEVKDYFDTIDNASIIPSKEAESVELAKKHAKWKQSLKPIRDKILEEVKATDKVIKTRKLPNNKLLKYFTLDAVNIYNHLASLMDEKTWAGSWLNRLFHKVMEQEAARQVDLQKALSKITKFARKMTVKESALAKGVGVKDSPDIKKGLANFLLSQISGLTSAPIQASELGKGITFKNLSEVLVALMYTNSKSGKEKFFKGGFYSNNKETGSIKEAAWDAFIKRLVDEGVLTKAHFDFIQEIHDQFEAIYPRVHKSFKDVEGVDIGHVKGTKKTITFPNGEKVTYRGGYYPLVKDNRFPVGEGLLKEGNMDKDKNFDVWYPAVDISMGKSRRKMRYPIALNLGRIYSLLGHHYSNAYLKRPLRAVEVIMKDKKVRERLESRQEGFYDRILLPWLNRTVRQQYTRYDDSTFAQGANFLRKNVYIYLFFGNVKSMAKQTLGWVQAVPTLKEHVGRFNVLKEILKTPALIANPRAYRRMVDKIGEVSPFMKNRMDNFQENLAKNLEELKVVETNLDKIQASSVKWSIMGLQYAQNIVDIAIWRAAYDKQIKDEHTEDQAIAYADGLVERSQAGSTVSSMTNAQFKTPFERLAYMITMVAHGLRGQLHEVRNRAKDKGEHYNLKTLHALLYFSAIPTLIQYAAGYAIASMLGDEEEEEKYLEYTEMDILGDVAYETMDIYSPLVSRFVAPILVPGTGEYMGMGPILYPLRKTSAGVHAFQRSLFDEDFDEFTGRDWDNMATAATLGTGIPFAPIGKVIRSQKDE